MYVRMYEISMYAYVCMFVWIYSCTYMYVCGQAGMRMYQCTEVFNMQHQQQQLRKKVIP